jgi:hypothetical protein
MTAEEHNKTLAMLHFIYGGIHGLTLAALALLIFVARSASPISLSISPFWIKFGIIAFVVVLVAVVLLPILAGYGLRKRKRWAKPVTIVCGIVSLINIPIGTALGIYAIQFFRSVAGSTLYGGSGAATETELQDTLRQTKRLGDLADRLN